MKQPSIIAVLVGGGVAGLCCWTYSGPYRWLAEWQLNTFGEYYQSYTFIILAMAFSVGADQIGRLVRRQATGGEEGAAPAWWGEFEAQSARFYQMFGGGIALLAFGAWSAWSSSSAEQAGLCRIPLSLLESGEERTSDWVRVSGTLLWDDCWGWGDDLTTVYYVPMVSANWKHGDPVTAFALYTEAEAEVAGDFETVEGMVVQTGLPGPIQTAFEEDGPRPASESFVVNANAFPSSSRSMDFVLMLLGLALTVGSLFLYESQSESVSQSEFVDVDVALEPTESVESKPASRRRGAATSLTDWAPPADADESCDDAVQEWLKAHNMQPRS